MKISLLSAILALFLAIGIGFVGESQRAAERPSDLIRPVPASWYAALPRNPRRATQAFLDRVPAAMRDRGEAISRTRYWALAARILSSVGAILFFLRSGTAAAWERKIGGGDRCWLQDLIFSIVLLLYVFVVTLPVEVIASYIRYRAFGFTDQPFLGWLQDYAFEWLGSAPFYAAGIAILMAVIRRRPRTWFLWAGFVYLALATLYTIATPLLIEPLTNSYTPLPDSPIKRDIVAMAHRAAIPATDVYTNDASRQSRRLNGHVSGAFGSARITIADTALGSDAAELEALAAHEVGHYAMGHPLKLVIFASLVATLGFALIAWLAPRVLRHYGEIWQVRSLGSTSAIAVFWLLFTGWNFIADPVIAARSRVQEAQADAFSLELARSPNGLAELMIQDADIARLDPTNLDVLLFYDHPSDASRVDHAMR